MAVRNVTQWQVRPGKMAGFLALAGEAKKIHERLGGSVRTATVQIGGPNSGNIIYAIEHKDIEAYAAFTTKLQADSAWLALGAKIEGQTEPTATFLGQSLLTDLPV